jgi:trans-aconitate methyltransferase
LIPIAGAQQRGRVEVFELGVAIALVYLALFPLRAAAVLLHLDPLTNPRVLIAPDADIRLTLALAALALAAGGVAYNASLGERLGQRVRIPRIAALDRPSRWLAWPIYLIGLAAQSVVLVWNPAGGGAFVPSYRLQGLVSDATGLMVIGLCLIARRAALDAGYGFGKLASLIAALAIGISVGVAGQFKETVLLVLLTPLVVWNFSRPHPITWRTVITVAVIVVIVVFPVVELSRHASTRLNTRNPVTVLAALPEQARDYDLFVGARRTGPIWSVLTDPIVVVSHRFYGFDSLVLAIRYTPSEIPFQLGGTLRGLFEGVVPRVLWPDKPNIGIGFWFAIHYWGTPSGVLEVPQTVSQPGELWIDFGAAGVIIGLALLGVWYRFLQAVLRPSASGTHVVAFTVVFISLVDVSRDIPFAYVTLLQRLVVLAVVLGAIAFFSQKPLFSIGRGIRLRHVRSAVNKLPASPAVLDAGCGDGVFAVTFARSHPETQVTAVDVDRKLVDGLSRDPERPANLSVTWAEVGGETIGKRFGLVVCVDVLEHIADDRKAMKWLVAHVEPGGYLVLHVPAAPQRHWLSSVVDAMEQEIRAGQGPHLREGYGPEGLRGLAEDAGLSHLKISYTFHSRLTQIAADVETWTYLHGAKVAKAALLPVLLAAGATEQRPSSNGAGNGLLLVARRSGAI